MASLVGLLFFFIFTAKMPINHSHKRKEVLNQSLAILLVVTLFFAIAIEAVHYHRTDKSIHQTTTSIVKDAPECVFCYVISHQVNTNFVGQDFHFECNSLMVNIEHPFDTYQLHFYQPTLQTSKNKGPPATLLVA